MKKQIVASLVAVLGGVAVPAFAAPLTVYSNDFDSAPVVGGGASASFDAAGGGTQATIAPYSATYGSIFRNSSTGLTELELTNLPSHDSVDVSFMLAFLDSWDSRDGGCCSPDNVDLYLDGTLIHSFTYNNTLGSIKDIGGGTLLAEYVQFDTNLGWSDTIVDLATDPALNFAHAGSSLRVGLQASGGGWQGGSDEAWGIDNLVVTVNATTPPQVGQVPEPGQLGLAGLALAALALGRRRIG